MVLSLRLAVGPSLGAVKGCAPNTLVMVVAMSTHRTMPVGTLGRLHVRIM